MAPPPSGHADGPDDAGGQDGPDDASGAHDSAADGCKGDGGRAATETEGPWNPGIGSVIPRALRPAITLYREENASLAHAEIVELADLTGLPETELAPLRPERLVVHELLVRVTADLTVPDGPAYADLGINLRRMVRTLHEGTVAPRMAELEGAHAAALEAARALIARELDAVLFDGERLRGPAPAPAPPARPWPRRLLGALGLGGGAPRRAAPAPGGAGSAGAGAPDTTPELAALALWRARLADGGSGVAAGAVPSSDSATPGPAARSRSTAAGGPGDARPPGAPHASSAARTPASTGGSAPTGDAALERACLEALARTVDAIVARRGRLLPDRSLIERVALILVGNGYAAERLGEAVAPLLAAGIEREGYRRLSAQTAPVVMNVKGASAAGKSTIRPLQRRLAGRLGVPWEDFALISPDYWRKYLLDYDTVGEGRKYAAMLTGEELAIVDAKLDRYMAAKAARGTMSHLLIDRFRFDSFTVAENRAAGSRLLTRFGNRIHLFFLITPPAETVERAWRRGLETGRYKGVGDLLYHNVEAFTGMPALFLAWVGLEDRPVRFEFLDNDVPEGTRPRTVAFGENARMTVLDIDRLLDVERFRKIDVDARTPEEVLAGVDLAAAANLDFVERCVRRLRRIDVVDADSGRLRARIVDGRLRWWDADDLDALPENAPLRAALAVLGHERGRRPDVDAGAEVAGHDALAERPLTLGRWSDGM